MINKGYLGVIIIILDLLLSGPTWGLKSSLYINNGEPPARQEIIIATLKELMVYKEVLNLLQLRKNRALEHLHSAKKASERRYCNLVVLKYESLELYYLSRALECLLNLNLLLYSDRKELSEKLKYIRILRTFLNQDHILSQNLYLMERQYLIHEHFRKPPDFKSWILNLRERYLALKREYSQL